MNNRPIRLVASLMQLQISEIKTSRCFLRFVLISFVFGVQPAHGATYTYTGLASSNTVGSADQWSAGTNWNAVPVSGTDTTLNISLTAPSTFMNNDLVGNFLLNRLNTSSTTTNNQKLILSGGTLEFVSDGATTPVISLLPTWSSSRPTPDTTISNNLLLTNDTELQFRAKVSLSGAISGAGSLTFTMPTSGVFTSYSVVTLSNASNSYSGGTIINGGTVLFAQTGALPSIGTVTVAASVASPSGSASLPNLGLNVGGVGEFTTATSGAGSIGGILSTVAFGTNAGLALDTSNNGGGISTYAGDISGAMRIVKLGGNTLELTGNNTFTGGAVPLNKTAFQQNFTGGAVSAGLVIENGFVSVGSIGNKDATSSNAGGAYNSILFGTGGGLKYTGAGETTDRVITAYGSTTGFILDQSGTSGNLNFSSDFLYGWGNGSGNPGKVITLQGSTAATGEISGKIGDALNGSSLLVNRSNSLVKTGTGTWILSGANTYSGGTTIKEGFLSVAEIGSAASTSSNLGGAVVLSGASGGPATGFVVNIIGMGSAATTGGLIYTGTGETTDRVINLAGTTGGAILDQSGALGHLNFTNNFTATGAGSKTLTLKGSTSGTGEISGAIVDNGGVNTTSVAKEGTGTWTLSGANTYSGSTSVSNGTLLIGTDGTINSSSGVAVTGGTFRYDGTTALDRDVTLNGGKFSYNSVNNYAGNLTFTSGTIGGSNVSNLDLTIGTGQTMSPGNSTGTMAAGDTTWATGGTFLFELNDTTGTAGSASLGWDLLSASTLDITAGVGEFTIQIASLDALQAAGNALNFDGNSNYTWLMVDAGSAITGFDAGSFILDDSAFTNAAPGTFSITQGTGGDIDKLYLNYAGVIPEPTTYAMLLGGLGLLAFLRRRRALSLSRHTLV